MLFVYVVSLWNKYLLIGQYEIITKIKYIAIIKTSNSIIYDKFSMPYFFHFFQIISLKADMHRHYRHNFTALQLIWLAIYIKAMIWSILVKMFLLLSLIRGRKHRCIEKNHFTIFLATVLLRRAEERLKSSRGVLWSSSSYISRGFWNSRLECSRALKISTNTIL